MKRVVRLTESDLVRLVKRVINENQKINSSWALKFTDWAKNRSSNPELAMKLMSRYWDLKNHPEMPVKYKDFNNLKDAEELQDLIDEMEEAVRINKLNQDVTRASVFRNIDDGGMDGDKFKPNRNDYHNKHEISVGPEAKKMRKEKEEARKRQTEKEMQAFIDWMKDLLPE